MKHILFSSVLFVTAVAITFHSCKKQEPDTETQSAVDNNICEDEFTKIMHGVNGFAINEQGVKGMMSACPTIIPPDTTTVPGWPRTLILDYGTLGCTDLIDGKIRKGQIICEFSDRWRFVGSQIKINLVNFSVNGITYACDSMKFIHSALTAFTTKIFKGKCQSPNWLLEWECDRTLTQTSGFGDTITYNDVFSLTGTASGKNRDSKNYSVSITTPLVKRSSCSWIESGRMDLTPEGLAVRTVDFGNGTCDNKASLIINGNTFDFTMN